MRTSTARGHADYVKNTWCRGANGQCNFGGQLPPMGRCRKRGSIFCWPGRWGSRLSWSLNKADKVESTKELLELVELEVRGLLTV